MSSQNSDDLTALLRRASSGDKEAENEVLSRVYSELHRIASNRLRHENPGHTLQPTALVNEAYIHIFGAKPVEWQNRAHFFAVAARQMRFILVDHARKKRKGGLVQITLDAPGNESDLGLVVQTDEDLIALDEALREFETIDSRACLGLELRFFAGLTQEEISKIQGIDVATVKRDWTFARSWLFKQLKMPSPTAES